MFIIIEILKSNKKILGKVALCKLVEGFFILLAAIFLVKFIDAPTEKFLLAAFGFFAGRFFLSGAAEKFFARLSVDIQTFFRKKIHAQIFGQEISSGELLTLLFDTVQSLDEFFLKVAPQISSAIIFLPIFLIAAAFTDLLTAAILLATLPIAPLLLWLIGRATAEKNSRAWHELQKLNGDFRELLAAITTLKMFVRVDAGAKKIRAASEKSSAATLDVLKLAFVSSFALELITTLSIALVAVTLGLRLVAGSVEFQAALFLLLLAPEFFLPVRKFGVAFHVMIAARASLERLKNFLRASEEVSGSTEKILMPPTILLNDVSFTYPKKFSPVLRGVSLKFSAGKVTALVGDSGAGKSTLLKLLAGILKPTAGKIIPNSSFLIPNCSYAPQAPHLFDAPLGKNFTMFDTLDDTRLKKFLSALNLSTLDLNATQKLSRGQLQRLGVIRALLKDAPIILLDEPTAGLDEATEQKVLALIKNFSARKTIIIATHRLAVIEAADEVVSI
ncbi:MAG: ATP-binding cassette domain-containing protein [Selenomonadaceae bacterium]|nr:ATP-binding cassette domain-containing protein [Selenomonadaceae bacterium]MBQ9496267.1 ATP-binding cassette domain-containing protein [Selenomonadaceae bacterium]